MSDRNPIKKAIAKVIRWAVTEGGNDSGDYQTQTVSYLRRSGKSVAIYPYGYTAWAPEDILSIMYSISGKSDARAHMPISGPGRKKIAQGENAMWHPSGSFIHMKNDGDIEIHAAKDLRMSATGNIIHDAVYHAWATGQLVIVGSISVIGNTVLGTTVTSSGKDISNTHTHSGVQTGGGSTGVPN